MKINNSKGGNGGWGATHRTDVVVRRAMVGRILAEMKFSWVLVASFCVVALHSMDARAGDRTRCFLPTPGVSKSLSIGSGSSLQAPNPTLRANPLDRPIVQAGVLPTEALGIDATSKAGERSWYRYMEVWKSGLGDVATRRWLGLPIRDEVQISTRRGRTSPRFLPWAPGSFVVLQTPHFEILSRADTAASQRVARDVERLYWAWTQMYFPLWSQRDQVAIAMEQWEPTESTMDEFLAGKAGQRLSSRGRHRIVLLPDAQTYRLTISNPQISAGASANIAASEGFYSDTLSSSFFYPQDSLSSLAHEITHQLFEEATDRSRRVRTAATTKDFWLIEGIAGHFESFHAGAKMASVGGWQSDRLQFIRYQTFIAQQPTASIEELIGTRKEIQQRRDLPRWYSQSILQTHLAMDCFLDGTDASRFRAGLLKRLADVYRVDVSDFPTLKTTPTEEASERVDRFLMVSDASIQLHPPYADAKSLCLAGCDVTDEGWKRLPEMPNLRWLDASRTPISSKHTLRILTDADQLEQLSLEATKIDNGIATIVSRQKQLRELDLSWTSVDDAFIDELKQCPQIETVWLTGTQVSDRGLSTLSTLPKLSTLDVQRSRVTKAALQQFRQARPLIELNPLKFAP